MDLHIVRIGISILSLVLMVYALVSLNYSDLSWDTNSSYYINLLTGFFVVLSVFFTYIHEAKQKKKSN
jgi:hypothetical protein